MRRLHTDSHNRIALAALQATDGYVDTLLGLAREQIMARPLFVVGKESWTGRVLASRTGAIENRAKLH